LEKIGKTEWIDRITPTGSGADIWQSVSDGGTIGVREFCAWCKLEHRVDDLVGFVNEAFPGAVMRERQGAKVRYEIPPKDGKQVAWRLSSIFGLVRRRRTLHYYYYCCCYYYYYYYYYYYCCFCYYYYYYCYYYCCYYYYHHHHHHPP